MQAVFWLILGKLLPLYLLILLGFVAGRILEVRRESIASILLYILAPGVVFQSLLTTVIDPRRITLPLFFVILCSTICLMTYQLGERLLTPGPSKNIAAFSSASGNTGYFGIPVAAFLFGSQSLGLVILCAFGFIIFESTLGFFITARGTFSPRESLKRVARIPTLYAFILGVVCNRLNLHLSPSWGDLGTLFRGAYSVLGMMMIGLGVSQLKTWKVDWSYISLTFVMKFLVWPVLVFTFLWLDRTQFHWYDPASHQVMALMAVVPLPANSVALATEFKTEPEKAALAVLLSTLTGLVLIPFLAQWH